MKLGVLASPESWYFRDLKRALRPTDELTALSFGMLSAGLGGEDWVGVGAEIKLDQFDAVIVRSMPPGSLEQIVFRMNALHRLEAGGTLVVNPPRCLEIAIDKYLASALLESAGLCTPKTLVSQTVDEAMRAFTELGGDVVVKPLFGSEGKGIARLTDESIAWRTFKTLVELRSVIYQQQYIHHRGFDVRLLVVGEEVLGIRRSNATDWRTNISRGARAEALDVTSALRSLAARAVAAVRSPIAAVDVLPAMDGRDYLLEVNAVPGWRALARTLDVDVASRVLAWIRERISAP
jgi:ribosomal protein S6--L-glutamate ligase